MLERLVRFEYVPYLETGEVGNSGTGHRGVGEQWIGSGGGG